MCALGYGWAGQRLLCLLAAWMIVGAILLFVMPKVCVDSVEAVKMIIMRKIDVGCMMVVRAPTVSGDSVDLLCMTSVAMGTGGGGSRVFELI